MPDAAGILPRGIPAASLKPPQNPARAAAQAASSAGEYPRQLFGERGSRTIAARLEQEAAAGTDALQGVPFPKRQERGAVAVRERRPAYSADDGPSEDRTAASAGATTLDRVHTGMLLQAAGQTNGLRALLKAERERCPDFLRL